MNACKQNLQTASFLPVCITLPVGVKNSIQKLAMTGKWRCEVLVML